MITMTEKIWYCPLCLGKNLDDDEYTAVPLCEHCDKDVHWDETLEAPLEKKV